MDSHSFYRSKAWQKKRKAILRRDKHLCRESIRYGKHVDATTVHHVFPLEEHPEWAFEDWNLISLCGEKHDAMHDRKAGKATALGRQWQERVSPHPKSEDKEKPGTGEGSHFQ